VDKNGITCDVSLCLPFMDSVVYSPQHPDSHTGDGLYEKKLGDQSRFYRLFYNTVSLVTLIPLVYYSISIRQAREAAGLTQEELARRLKTKKTAIPRIENHSKDTKLST
jgi:hypothetical protein